MVGHPDRLSAVTRRTLLGIALVLAVAGCTRGITSTPGEAPNLEKWVAEVKARPAPPLDPLPVMQQFETFEYAAHTLRDPFSNAFTDIDTGSGPRPDRQRRRQTLEQFPLDSLDMVGTLGGGAGTVALVMAPDKVTYRVRPGNYMGQNDGRVTGVFDDRIELVELVPDGAGGWLERPASVALEDQ
jgi:type IV pilus assembly protein PilP